MDPNIYDRLVSIIQNYCRLKENNELIYIGNQEANQNILNVFTNADLNDESFFKAIRNHTKDIDDANTTPLTSIRYDSPTGFSINNIVIHKQDDVTVHFKQGIYSLADPYEFYYRSVLQLLHMFDTILAQDEGRYLATLNLYLKNTTLEAYNDSPLFTDNSTTEDLQTYNPDPKTVGDVIKNHIWLSYIILRKANMIGSNTERAKYFYRSPKMFFEAMRLFYYSILQMYNVTIIANLCDKLQTMFNEQVVTPIRNALPSSADKTLFTELSIMIKNVDVFSVTYNQYYETEGTNNIMTRFVQRLNDLLNQNIAVPQINNAMNLISSPQSTFGLWFDHLGKICSDTNKAFGLSILQYENAAFVYINSQFTQKYQNSRERIKDIQERIANTKDNISYSKSVSDRFESAEFMNMIIYYITICIVCAVMVTIFLSGYMMQNNQDKITIAALGAVVFSSIVFYVIDILYGPSISEFFIQEYTNNLKNILDAGLRYLAYESYHAFYEKTVAPVMDREILKFDEFSLISVSDLNKFDVVINDAQQNILFYKNFSYLLLQLCAIGIVAYILYQKFPDSETLINYLLIIMFCIFVGIFIWRTTRRYRTSFKHTLWVETMRRSRKSN